MIEDCNEIINEFQKITESYINSFIEINKTLIDDYREKAKEAKMKNQRESCDFNVLNFFDVGETKHSFLLAKFLDPYAEHGQGNLFLSTFLEMLKIEKPNEGHWIVTAEKGRIDILLKRVNPHSIVIIENKSNDAIDQENQLYRYWYQEIYIPLRQKYDYDPIEYYKKHSELYQIVYLGTNESKKPSANSLTIPEGLHSLDPKLPYLIPDPKEWQFNIHIVEWLKKTLDKLQPDNYRMREYVNQYIEFWT